MKFGMIALCILVFSVGAENKSLIPILFLGDSLTEGYGVSKEKSYPTIVVSRLNEKFEKEKIKKQVSLLDGGISGSTSASTLSRLRWYLKAKPRVLFLAMGANDGLRGVPPKEMEKNLAATIELAQKEKIKIILAGMRLPPNYGPEMEKEFSGVYSRLARKYHLPFIPFLLEKVGGEKNLNIEDGIHPNENGHMKIANLVLPMIEKMVENENP